MLAKRAVLAMSVLLTAGLAPAADAARDPICTTVYIVPITVTTALGSVSVGGSRTVCV